MAVVIFNSSIESIVSEVQKLSDLEQKEILAFIRMRRLMKEPRKSFVKPEKGVKLLTMAQIDRIKHESRKKHAGK